jgi:hypothetical protein
MKSGCEIKIFIDTIQDIVYLNIMNNKQNLGISFFGYFFYFFFYNRGVAV